MRMAAWMSARRRFPSAHLSYIFTPIALFALNAWLIRDLFHLEYGAHMGSIECAYMALARFVIGQWPDISWFRYWYGGIPFESTYPPLLTFATTIWAVIRQISPALAYHQVVAAAYCLAPVALYLLAARLGASAVTAGLAGWVYSVGSPSALLIDEVRLDIGGRWLPRRFENLLPYGEGPHETALVFIPLAVLALDRALEKPSASRIAVAALPIAAVLATNWLGTSALGIAILCLLIARGFNRRSIAVAVTAGALGYGLVCVFLPPANVLLIQRNSRLLNTGYSTVRALLPAVVVLGGILYAFRRFAVKRNLPAFLQFFLYSALLFTALVLGQFWFGIMILPQAFRYQLEMDYALVFAAVFLAAFLLNRVPHRIRIALTLAAFAATVPSINLTRQWCHAVVIPIDVTKTLEYQTAMWAAKNVSSRIYLSGSTSFWLNVWADSPQLEGDFNNGITDWNVWRADTAALHESAESTLLWMKAFGVGDVEMVGGRSRNIYHYMQNPGKLDGVLPVARREGEDVIYRIDSPAASPAHAIGEGDLVHDPYNPDDLRRFVHALESSGAPLPKLTWTSNHSFDVRADLHARDIVSLSECWYPGWRASMDGKLIPLHADALGLMTAEPHRTGAITIHFEYRPSRWPLLVTVAAWLACLGAILGGPIRKSLSKKSPAAPTR